MGTFSSTPFVHICPLFLSLSFIYGQKICKYFKLDRFLNFVNWG